MSREQIIAQTILEQLGGNRFIVMTGAKNFLRDDRDGLVSLSFNIGRNSSRANKVKITLETSDTYTVRFSRFSRKGMSYEDKELLLVTDVYADTLREVFTDFTGLYTSLRG